jgi:hypothetical protein
LSKVTQEGRAVLTEADLAPLRSSGSASDLAWLISPSNALVHYIPRRGREPFVLGADSRPIVTSRDLLALGGS